MARKKASDGVVATIERLTGKQPCPTALRSTLNKYLYQEQLFEGAISDNAHSKAKKIGKLRGPDTDNLVRNLLDLDPLFGGETVTVIKVVTKTISHSKLNDELDNVERSMRQRLEIYSYWLDRIASARTVLADGAIDLKVDRLDQKLSVSTQTEVRPIPPFALHALRTQEASEAKGRASLPSASEYVERAEAYLALEDLSNADRNACAAIEQNPACARGWFIRVAIALRRRQSAMRTYQQKRIEAQEIAEPLSAHERWATEQADEAADDVRAHQLALDAILPQAISRWPQTAGRREYIDLWKQVRNLFIDRMFAIAVYDTRRAGTWQQLASLNGLEPEWELEYQKHPYASSVGLTEKSPFTAEETQAIADLLAAYDREPHHFFDTSEEKRVAIDFRLYHLRYVLRMDGGDKHWTRLITIVAQAPASWQADFLMRDPTVATLWQAHYCRHGQVHGLIESYQKWLQRTQAQSNADLHYTVLRQYAYLYHHQFARCQFDQCGEVARHASALFGGANVLDGWFRGEQHPYDESITMPIHRARYWEYLAAVAAVEQRNQGGELSTHAQAIVADERRWQEVFADPVECFWTASEEYEDGGGDDWPEPPYGIDLRERGCRIRKDSAS